MGQHAARQTGLALLRTLRDGLGSLDRVGRIVKTLYLIDGHAFAPRGGVRAIGADSRDVCADLGYSAADIDRLIAEGVLGIPEG